MNYILIGNFGNHSIAALQFLIEQNLPSIHFCYVDTGWAAANWAARVHDGIAYAQQHQVQIHQLKAVASFSEMVMDRKQFPSSKFQWCAGFLKGLAILNQLEEIDPFCEARIVSGKRRLDSRRFDDLAEHVNDAEHYNGRALWHPLYQTDDQAFKALVQRSGFDMLTHPSRECSPCIHLSKEQLTQLDKPSRVRLEALEKDVGQTMFEKPILTYSRLNSEQISQHALQSFDAGCGSPWCCGE